MEIYRVDTWDSVQLTHFETMGFHTLINGAVTGTCHQGSCLPLNFLIWIASLPARIPPTCLGQDKLG